jgi:hypothetical protein
MAADVGDEMSPPAGPLALGDGPLEEDAMKDRHPAMSPAREVTPSS